MTNSNDGGTPTTDTKVLELGIYDDDEIVIFARKLERELATKTAELAALQSCMPQPCCQDWDNCIQTCVPRLKRQLSEIRQRTIDECAKICKVLAEDGIAKAKRSGTERRAEMFELAQVEKFALLAAASEIGALSTAPSESAAPAPMFRFETNCYDGQKCGAVTTGCLVGECQRKKPLSSTIAIATVVAADPQDI